jgi:hypothetical protein
MKQVSMLLLVLCAVTTANSQGFITPLEEEDYAVIYNQPCSVSLANGEELRGRFVGGSGSNGYLNTITVQLDNGEKRKLKPAQIKKLSIKTSGLAKLALITESTFSIKEATTTNFDEIVNREHFIFETALSHNKKNKVRLLQLLNPGFDSKIKVYANPNANETMGLGLAGVKLTGGKDKSLLFVKGDSKAIIVRKGDYKDSFSELYATCPKMLQVFAGEKLKWQDAAGHVFTYDQICQE